MEEDQKDLLDEVETDVAEETKAAEEQSDTSKQTEKDSIEVDGEELSKDQLLEIVRSRKELAKENAKLQKQHKEIQKLATRKGVDRKSIERVTEEQEIDTDEDEFQELDSERDRRYLKKKIGVVTKEDIEGIRKELREELRAEIDNNSTVLELMANVDRTVKNYAFADKQEVVEYMHFKSSQGTYVSPEKAIATLYPGEFKKAPKPVEIPELDTSTKGNMDAPQAKRVGFDNPRGMEAALNEILFAGDQE